MCGIVGYIGAKDAAEILLDGLSNLEYRGYDSAGISILSQQGLRTVKAKGRLKDLRDRLEETGYPRGGCGIGHTRWATHGEPSDANSHPHATEKLSLVHNGIIENYLELRAFLTGQGYRFQSQTDTETAAKLIDYCYHGDPAAAIREAMGRIEGSYALGVLFADHPGVIYAVRKDSPLIIGLGREGENYIASDVPAILEHTRDYHLLEEGEIAVVERNRVTILDREGNPLAKERHTATWDIAQAQKGGYPHFMLKEIFEQPKALADTIMPRVKDGLPDFSPDGLQPGFFGKYDKLYVVACGTAYHAGIVGKSLIEQMARIPVEVDLASEFRYRNPILTKHNLVVVISQSGETADTLAALRLAKVRGVDTLAVVNVTGSSIAREADHILHTYAGPEIAVASTKAFSVQIALLSLLSIAMAVDKGEVDSKEARRLTDRLLRTLEQTKEVLERSADLEGMAPRFTETNSLFYLGRGLDYALAMEGSLKLKEISYIHSEAYAAGELKHGTISLITEGVPVVGLVTQQALVPKIISNIKEARSRGGYVLVIAKQGLTIGEDVCDDLIRIPTAEDCFLPILAVIVLQLFAYHISVARGCDVDKPRNLAKSVTVE